MIINFGINSENEREFKGNSLVEFVDDFVVVDLETTGLMPHFDSIIEIGAIKYKNNVEISRFHTFVSGATIDDFITELTGITNEMIADAPPINIAIKNLLDFVEDYVIVAHNANFDINFIYDNTKVSLNQNFTNNFIDTMRIARRLKLNTENSKLQTLTQFFKIPQKRSHRSMYDCEMTSALYLKLRDYLNEHNLSLNLDKKNYDLKLSAIKPTVDIIDVTNPFFGKVVVFTGALDSMQRKDAAQIIVNLGGVLGETVTKKTNYLILGDFAYCANIKNGKSTKYRKAEQLILSGQDLQILPEKVFLSMLKEEC